MYAKLNKEVIVKEAYDNYNEQNIVYNKNKPRLLI